LKIALKLYVWSANYVITRRLPHFVTGKVEQRIFAMRGHEYCEQ